MYDCSFLYNTYACVHAYMIYVCTRYSTCVHILLTQYMHIYTHMCACVCARNEMYPKYMHAYVYMHYTQISRYHHSIHQQNAPRACVCVSCIRPRASKSHASCLAKSSSWSKHLGGQATCFLPIFSCYYLTYQQLPWQWQSESPCRQERCRFRAAAAPGAHAGAV